MAKNPKKIIRTLLILCVVIGLAAAAVGVVAVYKEEYIIAAGMLFVAIWQVINFYKWKKLV
ncbi:MAG: hypothetical protein LUH12_02175 [Bacteroides sp.]|nr:hypothetical protein [Bacteroides sp.]